MLARVWGGGRAGARGWAGTRVEGWVRARVRILRGEWRDVFGPMVVGDAVWNKVYEGFGVASRV